MVQVREDSHRKYAADFETTTTLLDDGRVHVWSAAMVEINKNVSTNKVTIDTSIDLFLTRLSALGSCTVYFHNLKFDGMFILDAVLNAGWQPAHGVDGWHKKYDMSARTFSILMSEQGVVYQIVLCYGKGKVVTILDSLKMIPFSLREAGKAFKTDHQKLEMDYTGHNKPNVWITRTEEQYIKNDVYVLGECLQWLFDHGFEKSTVGSNCLRKYKDLMPDYKEFFPNLYEYSMEDMDCSVGDFVHKAYYGGWCFVAEDKKGKIVNNGCVLDVNSLYPFVMHSSSGNNYPVGYPIHYERGAISYPEKTYYVKIRCRFDLKEGKLPFLHIRGNPNYKASETLKTSDINGHKFIEGKLIVVDLTFYKAEYLLFLEHYDVQGEILETMYFDTMPSVFDDYINLYYNMKRNETGAKRTLSKLYLNNLYGRMAMYTDSSYKIPYLTDDGCLAFEPVKANDKTPGYIAAGAAITANARNYTIRAAQKNYTPGKPGFCYADTDSLHLDISLDEVVGVNIHDSDLGAWKCEGTWEKAVFVRPKCYLEIGEQETSKPEKTGSFENFDLYKYELKCAGLPPLGKKLLACSLGLCEPTEAGWQEAAKHDGWLDFISTDRTIEDFKPGLSIPGKLRPVIVPGGVLMVETTYLIKQGDYLMYG